MKLPPQHQFQFQAHLQVQNEFLNLQWKVYPAISEGKGQVIEPYIQTDYETKEIESVEISTPYQGITQEIHPSDECSVRKNPNVSEKWINSQYQFDGQIIRIDHLTSIHQGDKVILHVLIHKDEKSLYVATLDLLNSPSITFGSKMLINNYKHLTS